MPPVPASNPHHQLIKDYWARRASGLSTAEWEELYRLVVPILMATRLPQRYAEPQARRDLVVAFFSDKIFANAATSQAGPLHSVHALHRFLKNYAKDIDKADNVAAGAQAPSEQDDDEPWPHADGAPARLAHASLLFEAGIDIDQADASAAAFVDGLDKGERAYLGLNTCADEADRQPVSGIASRLALGSSYHYKARQLGITRSKGETFHGYQHTKIGAWLLSLGAQLNEEWRDELAVLLTLLCLSVNQRLGEQA